jgi:Gpi18-like mannosyltransferase
MKYIKSIKLADLLIVIVGVALAVAVRYSLLSFKSGDYLDYTRKWYNTIKSLGFSGFRTDFSNYNPPYLYLLYFIIRFFPDIPSLIVTKLPSIVSDFILAWLVMRIVRLKYPQSPIPLFAGFTALFAPTVILNSAFWGQADSLYTTFLMAALYFFMLRKNFWAMFFWGVAIAFKMQAVFVAPVIFALFLRKEISWKHLLLVPLVMFAALVPAWIAGRSILDLLKIYPSQTGQYQQLSMSAPSLYSWIPNYGRYFLYFHSAGLVFAAMVGLYYSLYIYKSRLGLTPALILTFFLGSVILMPFVLPQMHERYFYPADVISIIFAFYFPEYFFVPIIMTTISFFAYQPYLFNVEPIPIGVLAIGVLGLLVLMARHVYNIQISNSRLETES